MNESTAMDNHTRYNSIHLGSSRYGPRDHANQWGTPIRSYPPGGYDGSTMGSLQGRALGTSQIGSERTRRIGAKGREVVKSIVNEYKWTSSLLGTAVFAEIFILASKGFGI